MADHEPSADAGGSLRAPPVIGLAHGSRLASGAADIESLMAAAGRPSGLVGWNSTLSPAEIPPGVAVPSVPAAYAAYLDLCEPDLASVVSALAARGHRRVVVVPLLFTAAYHARIDAPQTIDAVSAASDVELLVSDILGTGDDIADLLLTSLDTADTAGERPVVLYAVGSSDSAANEAVADLADRMARWRGGQVVVAYATTDPRLDATLSQLDDAACPVLLPLFLADGLLLGPLRRLAAERGWPLIEPLADRAAELVRRRYDATLARHGVR